MNSRHVRKRPKDAVYWLDEKPPLPALLGLGLQHALLTVTFSIYAVIVGQGIGLGPQRVVNFVSACLVLVGLVTLLNALRTRFTAGMLLVAVPNPILMGAYIAVTLRYGVAATMGGVIVSNLIIMMFARALPRLRSFFPSEVIGVVIFMLGLSLVTAGVTRAAGLDAHEQTLSFAALASSGVTLASIVGLSIWGNARLRVLAVPIGALLGVAVAVASHPAGSLSLAPLAHVPLFAAPLPSFPLPLPQFVLPAIVAIFIPEFVTAVDGVAASMAMDRMSDANWRRPDMGMAARAMSTMACVNILNGVTGTLTSGLSSASIGLVQATGSTARRIGIVAGLMIMVVAFLPQFTGLFVLTPAPVVGGIVIFTAAYMVVAGMDLVLSRMLNQRRIFTVGLSIVVGSTVMLLPRIVENAPDWSHAIIESGLTVSAVLAIALNALFRIGVAQTKRVVLASGASPALLAESLEEAGMLWGCRRDVILRASGAVAEAVEALRAGAFASDDITLLISFDEFNLICTLYYEGDALLFADTDAPSISKLLDADDETIERAMRRISLMLVKRFADRVRASTNESRASLWLQFDH